MQVSAEKEEENGSRGEEPITAVGELPGAAAKCRYGMSARSQNSCTRRDLPTWCWPRIVTTKPAMTRSLDRGVCGARPAQILGPRIDQPSSLLGRSDLQRGLSEVTKVSGTWSAANLDESYPQYYCKGKGTETYRIVTTGWAQGGQYGQSVQSLNYLRVTC